MVGVKLNHVCVSVPVVKRGTCGGRIQKRSFHDIVTFAESIGVVATQNTVDHS